MEDKTMKQIRFYIALMFVSVLATSAMAQLSPVDFMRNNPRAVFANPATYTVDNGYFDLGFGGINIGLVNTSLKYNRFFQFDDQGYPTVLDLDKGIKSLHKKNYVNTYANVDIFNCGRRTKYGYFTYAHRFREIQSLSYSKDMVQLLVQGNGSYLGEDNPANIDIKLAARVFQEFDFGYQMSLMEQLNVGVRLKFLMGFADLKTDGLNMRLYTDPDTYALKLTAEKATIQGTLPYQFTDSLEIVDKRFNLANLFKNYGTGIDLGAEYRINDQWGVAAAINDLGFIVWNNYATQFEAEVKDNGSFYEDGSFVFSGLNSEQIHNILNTEGYTKALMDSLKNYYQISVKPMDKYTTGLKTNMMVRGYYDLTPEHRFTAQLMGYNMGLGMKPALTLVYTGSFNNKYDVVATYTMMPGSFDNIGVGLSANFGGALLYFATNNLLGFFSPSNITPVNAKFGISFTSGETVDRSEMIILRDVEAEADAEYEASAKEE